MHPYLLSMVLKISNRIRILFLANMDIKFNISSISIFLFVSVKDKQMWIKKYPYMIGILYVYILKQNLITYTCVIILINTSSHLWRLIVTNLPTNPWRKHQLLACELTQNTNLKMKRKKATWEGWNWSFHIPNPFHPEYKLSNQYDQASYHAFAGSWPTQIRLFCLVGSPLIFSVCYTLQT